MPTGSTRYRAFGGKRRVLSPGNANIGYKDNGGGLNHITCGGPGKTAFMRTRSFSIENACFHY